MGRSGNPAVRAYEEQADRADFALDGLTRSVARLLRVTIETTQPNRGRAVVAYLKVMEGMPPWKS